MKIVCKGNARIKHAETGELFNIEEDELDWESVGGDERQMGPEIHYEASIEHTELGTLTWGLWEYPVGVQNYNKTEIGSHILVQDFEYGLEHEPE